MMLATAIGRAAVALIFLQIVTRTGEPAPIRVGRLLVEHLAGIFGTVFLFGYRTEFGRGENAVEREFDEFEGVVITRPVML